MKKNDLPEVEDIVATVREPLLVLDANLNILSANRSFYRIFKVEQGETIGHLIFDVGNKQWDIPALRTLLEDILPKHKLFDNYEVEHDFPTIGHKTMLLNARQIQRVSGKERIILLAIEDITERRRLEDLLTESEERFRRLFETANDGILLLEKHEGKITHANPAATEMLGYSKEECIGQKLQNIGVSLDMGDFQKIMQTLDKSGIIYYDDVPVKTKAGQYIDTDIYMVDRARLAQCNIRDVTERKRAEAEREKLLEDLGERVKELGCINDISRLAEEPWISIEKFVQQAVGILPPAWRYPEICAARITLDSKEFKTANFRETEWSQSADIIVDRKKCGAVTICYLEEKPAVDEGPFLKEERNLINTAADFLGHIVQHRLSEAEIRASEEKFRMIFDNANDGILLADTESKKFHFANITICRMLGYSLEEIKNMGVMDIHPEKDIPYVIEQFEKQSRKEIEVAQSLPMKRKDGSGFYADVNSAPVEISGKRYLLGIFRDITERKQAEKALRKSEGRFQKVAENIGEWIWEVDANGLYTYSSPTVEKILGYKPEEITGNKHFYDFFLPEEREELKTAALEVFAKKKAFKDFINRNVDKSGNEVWILTNGVPILDEDGNLIGYMGSDADISERKGMEDRLQYLAYYDSLTGLPNRNLFLERINQEIAEAKNSSSSLAVVIADINKFKSIYDIYGSEFGDRVLREVAERLSTAVRKGGTVARLGNNEFGIACIGLAGADDIIMLEKIIKDISYPLKIDKEEIILTFSSGIAVYPHDGENAHELLKAAGLALSIAEKQGSKLFQFYTKDMSVTASEVMLLEKQLVTAIKNEEFILHYQPYWDITTKKMVGMEALVRWQSKDKGLVPPGKFIPILEDTGMIIEVGEWILREAMRQVKEWQNNGHPVVPVSVNLSLIQFRQKDLAEMVKRIMGECGFYPSLLTLEITESAFMQDVEFTRSVLTAMKEIGCSVSIDDFGTGYSSMAYLKRFPIDNLKIDISFIREVVRDPDSASIVMAIINMAHTLSLKTIAEGIETEEQWNILRLFRCDMGQGFYLSKPLTPEEFEKLLI